MLRKYLQSHKTSVNRATVLKKIWYSATLYCENIGAIFKSECMSDNRVTDGIGHCHNSLDIGISLYFLTTWTAAPGTFRILSRQHIYDDQVKIRCERNNHDKRNENEN